MNNRPTIPRFTKFLLICMLSAGLHAHAVDSLVVSTRKQAIEYLKTIPRVDSSKYWPNVDPVQFMQNLNAYVNAPMKIFESKNTNFCAYTALSYLPLNYDPLGFVKFMLNLYRNGKAKMGTVNFHPSQAVRNAAGTMKYKGILDISPAIQIWFLSLADEFKGYLNVINKKYDAGDENRLWAATNFAKFNRMLRKLFPWKVRGRGADLFRPNVNDVYTYLEERINKGTVFLYLNNRLLYRKKHVVSGIGIPTHYVVLMSIERDEDLVVITYMDSGRKTVQKLTPDFLKKIIFGITLCETPVS